MQCIRPIKAGFDRLGNICYNSKLISKELVGTQFECRKCLPCRLNIARDKAIRAWHESKIHENCIFLTLTYDEDHLESPRLIYEHWQKFAKDLRARVGSSPDKRISLMVTGEYGEEKKRPHWHALVFNYRPSDARHKYTSDRGDDVFESDYLHSIWRRGSAEFGAVTLESANYVARYAAKKLVHGKDQDHDFHPIHKTSSKNAIGKRWIEKNYKHTLENGFIVLPDGTPSRIPRYYVDWAKIHQPILWERYVTEVRPEIQKKSEEKARKEELEFHSEILNYDGRAGYPLSRPQVKHTILKLKFKQLQERLKL